MTVLLARADDDDSTAAGAAPAIDGNHVTSSDAFGFVASPYAAGNPRRFPGRGQFQGSAGRQCLVGVRSKM